MAKCMDVILGRRSVRRFARKPVPRKDLVEIVNAGRLAASAGNRQPWQFILVDDASLVENLFASLGWLAGSPDEKERPTALVVVLLSDPKDKGVAAADGGAAVQNMQLAAWDKGLGSCWIGSADASTVAKILKVPAGLKIFSVLALGYPAEKPVIEDSDSDVSAKRDDAGTLHVKKLTLAAVLSVNEYGKKA
jgi:FMN reductase [NAD(P)H]